MAKNDNLKDFLTDVADAIREKKGTTDLINPQDFSAEIASIQSGGGAVAVSAKAVNFRDYDGVILHSYTKDEFLALTELPPLPTREGLICQEWNWDFADAVEYVTEYGVLEVGATYITDDGKTRLYITIAAEGRMDVPLYFQQTVANGVTIDWGDGSATETISSKGYVNTTHHYNAIGDYIISLEVAEGCTLGLGHSSYSYSVLGATGNNGKVYCNVLRKTEIGNGVSKIDIGAFQYCMSMETITIHNNVTIISAYAMYGCYSLLSVIFPKGVILSGDSALQDCYSLSSISIPSSAALLGQYFLKNCYSMQSLNLAKVSEVGNYAFQNCRTLSSVALPQMNSLRNYAFDGCYSLSSIVLLKLKSIGSYVFQNCYGMSIYDFSTIESIPSLSSTSSFTGISSDCKIIVPDALYDTWIAATNWSTYASKTIKKSEWDALNA